MITLTAAASESRDVESLCRVSAANPPSGGRGRLGPLADVRRGAEDGQAIWNHNRTDVRGQSTYLTNAVNVLGGKGCKSCARLGRQTDQEREARCGARWGFAGGALFGRVKFPR